MGEDLQAKNPLWYGSDITPYEVMINHHSYTQLKQLQNLSEKKFRPEWDSYQYPLDTGAVLCQLSYQTNWEPVML